MVLQHNIVAGFERVAYRIDGEPCPGTRSITHRRINSMCRLLQRFCPSLTLDSAGFPNKNEKWEDNEAHGGLFGVYMNKDGLPGCSQIRGFFIWKSFDHGIYFQVFKSISVLISIFSAPKNKIVSGVPEGEVCSEFRELEILLIRSDFLQTSETIAQN